MDEKKKVMRNIDGEIIDFGVDDLKEKLTFESANFIRRGLAFVIDLLLMIVIWYLVTLGLFKKVDVFVANLGVDETDFLSLAKYEEFRDLIWKLFMNVFLIWIGIKIAYFTLFPAIIGEGRSLGKLLAGIGVVDSVTLEEIQPLRLVLREVVGRGIFETLLVIPWLVSFIIAFVRPDSKCLHDFIAKTVVIKLDLYNVE